MAIFFSAFILIMSLFIYQGKLIYEDITDPAFLQSIENWFAKANLTQVYELISEAIKKV